MFPNRAFTHPPGNPLGYHPHSGPVYPHPPNPHGPPGPPNTSAERDPAWEQEWRKMKGRMNYSGPGGDFGGEHVPPPSGFVPRSSAPQRAVVDMESLVKWIGEHVVGYNESPKVKDLAERACHNMDSFLSDLSSYRDMRQRARREQWGPRWTYEREDLHHRALSLQRLYESTVGRYEGPFKPKQDCSETENTQAQQLLTTMFDRDYEIWNGFIGQLTFWTRHFRYPMP